MRYSAMLGVGAIVITFLLGAAALAQSGTSVNVCGVMTEYRAPTQTQPGTVTVGGEQFAISSDARQNVSPAARTGTDVCLTGTWVMSQTVGRNLIEVTIVPRSATATATALPTLQTTPQSLPSTTASPASNGSGTLALLAIAGVAALAGASTLLLRTRRS